VTPRYLLAEAAEVPADDTWLAPSEEAFQRRLHIPHRRADWRLGRWAAKRALAAWLGHAIEPEILRVAYARPTTVGVGKTISSR